jgi:hypothetical protein
MVAAVQEASGLEQFKIAMDDAVASGRFSQGDIRVGLVAGWCSSVERCLEDGLIDNTEEQKLMVLKTRFKLAEEELDADGVHTRFVQAAVLRDVLSGIVPERYTVAESLPINLQRGEKVVWAFAKSEYWEDKTKRTYQGGSRGVSVRVMKGVYYRVGAFKGAPVFSTERVLVDSGLVVVTNKHIYFVGPAKSLRVSYAKIVSFLPFDDGVGVVRDAQTAKPQIFKVGDGWFIYNLVTNLAQLESRE